MIDPDIRESMHLVRESARGIVTPGDLRRVRDLRYAHPGFDRATWREMCDMGWLTLRLPDESDGTMQSMLLYCALAEEFGRGLLPEPLVPATLAAALMPRDALARHLSGEALVMPAWQDSRGALAPEHPLDIGADGLNAVKLHVPFAAGADAFLVIGSTGAALVEAGADGVGLSSAQLQDGGNFARVVFDGAVAERVDIDPKPAFAEAALATAAYLLGVVDASLEMTVEYLKTRVQFGRQIGSFQVLQHMAVDLKLEASLTRASIEDAALRWDRTPATADAYAAISRAYARASRAAMSVTRNCIQLHGGIGFTDEHDISLYLRKSMVIANQFGSASEHAAHYAALRPIQRETRA